MKIANRRRLFRPQDHELPWGRGDFAQSPQALAVDGRVRIYFTTREAEPGGMFVSHPAFVEFDDDLQRITRICQRPLMTRGALGAFDEHGVFPINPLRVGDEVWAYTCGWSRRVSTPVETAIGLAVSVDGGETFARRGDGPVMAATVNEPCLVGDPFAVRDGSGFAMAYMFGRGWSRPSPDAAPERVYKIGMAFSDDGVEWRRASGRAVLPDRRGPSECQALPSIAWFDGLWRMVFCHRAQVGFRDDPALGYRIGYAWSRDLRTWTRDDDALGFSGGAGDWDGAMQCYPSLFVHQGRLLMFYNGDRFGREGFGMCEIRP